MQILISGTIEASPLATSPEEIQKGINEWLRHNVCNSTGDVIALEVKPEAKTNG